MTKKAYVAASFEHRSEVKKLYEQLHDIGYAITTDWTDHKGVNSMPASTERDMLARQYVVEDSNGVEAADVFILLLSERKGTGSHIELGIAIGAKTPQIFVVGPDNGDQLFYKHPRVTHASSIKELLAQIGNVR